ncbi:UDP-3-O-acyl-N-acetylglucosamine deacetylase [Dialister pneumosintes]|uniref:UDP-3-O-acyl-N-acetylglucosamine deacetylase n=1 Tax=Dialister pneumosintes TaxID=39950 RepID=A0ABX9MEP0_9FIRM|nr:UDP-3-O-acyl-N-acetylglucosamine deacetylase [Dialister pneumosintes]MBS6480193.1 UDP-3-O-[3-hydroxymyristoyl] N-acetylglucosamine deacetylase [Dialister sp.]RID94768.1 UDP-3-O-[3-hydroxymyristoyl] N-acetylglucosamine deacetylase [Dialister pneumosintes]CDF27918.1 uDP-3-O-[3-hydroxymyristoyl] N-acetylglucosamine deacetylase [Dialister sp. CAG:588]
MKRLQHSIKKTVVYKGNGLHSGIPVTLTMHPAAPGTGIIFRRIDLPNQPEVPAHINYVTNTLRATTLERNLAKVFTVEHILSGLYALQIDNCIIEMDSPEPPVGDGSSKVFVDLILEAGIETQKEEIEVFELPHSVSVYEEDKFIAALPYKGLRVTFTSVNPHPLLGTQVMDLEITSNSYIKEISSARTIGFTKEIETMRKMGLGLGGTLENAVVYSEKDCLSKPRWSDELVRHKILDILGDVSLVGPFNAHIIAVLGSHKLNADLSAKLIQLRNEYECK